MKYSNCNHENTEGAKFCNQCGTKLPVLLECPVCHNKNIPTDSKFCPDCGAYLKSEDTAKMRTITVDSVSFDMIFVEAGTFIMGATKEISNPRIYEKPLHQVSLTNNYYLGKVPVTQRLWKAVMGYNPSNFQDDNKPVESVTWYDCITFIAKLNIITRLSFRLPTEAEWEYAARGGRYSRHSQYSGSDSLMNVGWYRENSNGMTHRVATKQPNELGIYDMTGNVWEWCVDLYDTYGVDKQIDPSGPCMGYNRIYRGGSWNIDAESIHLSCRGNDAPNVAYRSLGFRLALSI